MNMTQTLVTNSASSLVGASLTIPTFQRDIAWKVKDQQLLITSVLLDFKIPQVYLRRCGRTRLEVIDGQQRLTSIRLFAADKFPVGQQPYFNDDGEIEYKDLVMDLDGDEPVNLTGMLYSEMPKEAQQIFDTYNMSVVEMTNCSTEEARKWFLLINEQAKTLNPVEKRGAYGGNIPIYAKKYAGSGSRNKAHDFFSYCNYPASRMAHVGTMYQFLILSHTQGPCALDKKEVDGFVREQTKMAKDALTVTDTLRVMDYMAEAFAKLSEIDTEQEYVNAKGKVKGLKKTAVPALFTAILQLLILDEKCPSVVDFANWWMDFSDRLDEESPDTEAYRLAIAKQTDQDWSVTARTEFFVTELEAITGVEQVEAESVEDEVEEVA